MCPSHYATIRGASLLLLHSGFGLHPLALQLSNRLAQMGHFASRASGMPFAHSRHCLFLRPCTQTSAAPEAFGAIHSSHDAVALRAGAHDMATIAVLPQPPEVTGVALAPNDYPLGQCSQAEMADGVDRVHRRVGLVGRIRSKSSGRQCRRSDAREVEGNDRAKIKGGVHDIA